MWPFRSAPKVSRKRVSELQAELDDAHVAIAWLRRAVKELNGRVSTVQREQKPAQDAPEPTNGDELAPYHPPPVASTAHLSRRFRVP